MLPLKFACNIGTMFESSLSLKDRLYQATKVYRCGSIEVAFPYQWSVEEWKEALDQYPLDVVLINTPKGENGEPGLAASCGKSKQFLRGLAEAIKYCKALNCKSLHIMAGNEPEFEGQKETFTANLTEASMILMGHRIEGLIETISEGVIPDYYLNSAKKALDIVHELNLPNISFQFDVFHMSMLGHKDEEILQMFKDNKKVIKHIQVAQSPARNELNDKSGNVDYNVMLRGLAQECYDGCIGLEFTPSSFKEEHITDFIKFLDRYYP